MSLNLLPLTNSSFGEPQNHKTVTPLCRNLSIKKKEMKKLLWIALVLLSHLGFAQNRAPSCWLRYQDNFQGDILINTVSVQYPSPTYTYYCALQWNAGMEGGGYCGIQEHPNGRNYIFSIWDPISSSDPITAAYTHSGTQIESFGGEGTGLKSWNFQIGWETNQWYSFVTRVWDRNTHTMFGYWVFNHSAQEWYHLVTMDYPVANVRFNSSTNSFIEDWYGNGWNTREVHHKEGWKRKTNDLSWHSFTNAFFNRVSPDPGAANYIDNYDGGIESDYYFMKSGGTIAPETNTSGTMLSLDNNNSNPGFPEGEISELHTTVTENNLTLEWEINVSKSPQFSYHVKIYDNPDFSGSPMIQLDQTIPHARTSNIDISSLVNGSEYYIRFYIIDIFDNESTPVTGNFINEVLSADEAANPFSIAYYPNPFQDKIYLKFTNRFDKCSIELMDILGSSIFSKKYYFSSEIEFNLPKNIEKGVYFLRINCLGNQSQTIRLLKE